MKVAFIHPDLGIGGAERLVVDAALGMQQNGHDVIIYTSHCDLNHCFEEVKDGTLKVAVLGKALPAKIFGRFAILCAILRQLLLTWQLIRSGVAYDVFVVDQLSICIPFLQLYTDGRVLFYGHFPDQLLAKRTSWLKSLYRVPFDWLEAWSTGHSDVVVVNSKFTRNVFKETMRHKLNRMPEVIYPCVDTNKEYESDPTVAAALRPYKVLMSVNRFERTKKVDLAVEAFAQTASKFSDALLVVAGGYDHRVDENVDHLQELQKICDDYKLKHVTRWASDDSEFGIPEGTKVLFLPSVSTLVKNTILQFSKLLLYTPANEHFGIVPLEGMQVGLPVLAADSGGPLETIVEGETGWNRPQDAQVWAEIITKVLSNQVNVAAMGAKGKARVQKEFSFDKMAKQFGNALDQACHVPPVQPFFFSQVMNSLRGVLVMIFVSFVWRTFNISQQLDQMFGKTTE